MLGLVVACDLLRCNCFVSAKSPSTLKSRDSNTARICPNGAEDIFLLAGLEGRDEWRCGEERAKERREKKVRRNCAGGGEGKGRSRYSNIQMEPSFEKKSQAKLDSVVWI
jgi:hypothetical protein